MNTRIRPTRSAEAGTVSPGARYDSFPGAVAWVAGDGRRNDRCICHDRFKRRLRHGD